MELQSTTGARRASVIDVATAALSGRGAAEGSGTHMELQQVLLGPLQDSTGGRGHELVCLFSDLIDCTIDGVGNLIRYMTGDVLSQCRTKNFAARTLGAPGETFHFLKDIIRNRNGCLHTMSMISLCLPPKGRCLAPTGRCLARTDLCLARTHRCLDRTGRCLARTG